MDLTLQYDLLNRLTNVVDAVGTTKFTYTDGGQLLTEDGPWSDDTVSYSYTARRRTGLSLTQPGEGPWTQSYDYDHYDRLTNVTSAAGRFGRAYWWAAVVSDRVETQGLPGDAMEGNYSYHTYDGLARLTATVLYGQGGNYRNHHTYEYNAANQRTRQTFMEYTTANYVDYTYDAIGQLKTAKGWEYGGSVQRLQEQFGYGYDAAWNLNKRTNNALVQTLNTDSKNQLTSSTRDGTFTVAGVVGPGVTPVEVTVSGTDWSSGAAELYADNTWARAGAPLANGNNSYTAEVEDNLARTAQDSVAVYLPATVNFTYDGNGNLTNDGRRVFDYDFENQLTNVYVASAWKSEFRYDAFGRKRVQKDYTWSSGIGNWQLTNEVRYVYDGMLVLQERNASNVPQITYTRGNDLSGSLQGAGGIGGLLARTDSSQSSSSPSLHSYYHADGNGNITAMINVNGTVLARYHYDPYGNVLRMSGPLAEANTYRFSSKEWHANAGLYYYGYRFYEPNLQRWLNRDPIVDIAGLPGLSVAVTLRGEQNDGDEPLEFLLQVNLHAFAANSPITRIDILGLYTSYEDCALAAQQRYVKRGNYANWKVFKGHIVGGAILGVGCLVGGCVVIAQGGANLIADAAEAAMIVGEAALVTHAIIERKHLEEESKAELEKDLADCREKFPVPAEPND